MKLAWSAALPDFAPQIAFAPDGSTLAAATLAGPVRVLDTLTGESVWEPARHAGGALAVAFSPRGDRLATGGQDGRTRVLDVGSRAEVFAHAAGGDWVAQLVWSGDGAVLAAAAGRVVRFFSAQGAPLGEVSSHVSTVTSLFWDPVLGFGSACYGGVQLLAPGRAQPVKRLPFRGSILVAAPSPDGRFVAAGNQDSSVRFWGCGSAMDADLRGYPGKVRVLAWGRVGPLLATGGGDTLVVWPCDDRGPVGRTPMRLERHTGRVAALAFVRGGAELLSAGEDGRVCRWAVDGVQAITPKGELKLPAALRGIAVAAGGTRGVVQGAGGSLHAWEM